MQKSSVNKIILVEHLGNKPEGRYTATGVSTASFSLATNESWIDSDNNNKNELNGTVLLRGINWLILQQNTFKKGN